MKNLNFKIIFSLFTLISCGKKGNSQNIAIDYYEKQLSLIEDYYNGHENTDTKNAIITLEKISKIKSIEDFNISQKPFKTPLKHNIEDWKKWLALNKEIIIFNKEKEELEIEKGKTIIPLDKEPLEVFIGYINDLKKMSKNNKYHINEIDFRLSVLGKITSYKDIDFHKDCDCFFPIEKDFKEFDKWFKLNKEKLIWNKKEQKIEVSPLK